MEGATVPFLCGFFLEPDILIQHLTGNSNRWQDIGGAPCLLYKAQALYIVPIV
jgi:hypothetical protein